MEFTNTVTIEREPAEVFAFLSDFENLPRWNYALDRTQRVDASAADVRAMPLR